MLELPKLQEDWGYDVCGRTKPGWNPMRGTGIPERFFVTHRDIDHLTAFGGVTLLCAEQLVGDLKRIYGRVPIELQFQTWPRSECIETWHGRETERHQVKTYGYHYKDTMVIPECHNALELLKEHAPKCAIVIFFKQPRAHPQQYVSPEKLRELCDHAYFADVSTMRPTFQWVIPQCVPSIQNVRENPKTWFASPFSKYFRER